MQSSKVTGYTVAAVIALVILVAALLWSLLSSGDSDLFRYWVAVSCGVSAIVIAVSIPMVRSCEQLVGTLSYDHAAAMQSLKQMMSVIDTAYDGIVVTDHGGVIRYVNPAWEKITGYSSEEAVGKLTPAVLKSGKHDSEFYSNMWLTIQHGNQFHGELVNKRKDGTMYRVDEIILPLKNKEGKVTGYAAFHHDITAQKPVV
ncbi:PAS domain S-box protein [Patescibacteria group bacterium]|jgi:PAS domain S-box-containing protein|nr:PAS domain S-box protein [Patescibacteria group bacterium]